jgi:membrane protein implicated in regulation of membrane protease activity
MNMITFFVICATVGGTILICQFVLTLVGMGGHGAEFGGTDAGHGFGDVHHDVASPEGHDAHGQHGSTWLFSVLSLRALVAASTFFGLGGLTAESLQQSPTIQLLVALASGGAALYAVNAILRLFGRVSEDGTVRIQRAVGCEGTVYLTIPPQKTGLGKIHISLQNRIMEYAALTATGEQLATGAKVVVIRVVGTDTLEVEPLRQQVEAA